MLMLSRPPNGFGIVPVVQRIKPKLFWQKWNSSAKRLKKVFFYNFMQQSISNFISKQCNAVLDMKYWIILGKFLLLQFLEKQLLSKYQNQIVRFCFMSCQFGNSLQLEIFRLELYWKSESVEHNGFLPFSGKPPEYAFVKVYFRLFPLNSCQSVDFFFVWVVVHLSLKLLFHDFCVFFCHFLNLLVWVCLFEMSLGNMLIVVNT